MIEIKSNPSEFTVENGELKKVLFVGTGALMSSVSSLQSESVPSIAHGILLTGV